MFASFSRLDLGITVGARKPGHIKTILSGPLPIFVYYDCVHKDMTRSALWRMRASLKQHNRVRDISVAGTSSCFDKFFRATNCTFPMLEGLYLRSGRHDRVNIPDTFLGGPDLSVPHLRRLQLGHVTLTAISRLLFSASNLTHLDLCIDTAFGTSPETSLLAYLQGAPFLCRLGLCISESPGLLKPRSPPSTLKDIVRLSKLTSFRYMCHSEILDALVAGLSAPFLQDVRLEFNDENSSPIVHLSRFINETEEGCHALHVTFYKRVPRLSWFTRSGHCWLQFRFRSDSGQSTEPIMRMSAALSTKLTTVEELRITFIKTAAAHYIPWCRFHQQFPNVKLIRVEGRNYSCIARTFLQDQHVDDLAFFPALEKIELGEDKMESQESRMESRAAFNPFISARQQAGRPVNVFFCP